MFPALKEGATAFLTALPVLVCVPSQQIGTAQELDRKHKFRQADVLILMTIPLCMQSAQGNPLIKSCEIGIKHCLVEDTQQTLAEGRG